MGEMREGAVLWGKVCGRIVTAVLGDVLGGRGESGKLVTALEKGRMGVVVIEENGVLCSIQCWGIGKDGGANRGCCVGERRRAVVG